MAEVRWTPQAAEDLEAIAAFIASDSPQYSRLFIGDLLGSVERLARFPKLGRVVPELEKPFIRELLVGHYRVVYRLARGTVQIPDDPARRSNLRPGTLKAI